MHKKIMEKASKKLVKDADKYKKHEAVDKRKHDTKKLKEDKIEEKEARSAARDLKARAKKAHEYWYMKSAISGGKQMTTPMRVKKKSISQSRLNKLMKKKMCKKKK